MKKLFLALLAFTSFALSAKAQETSAQGMNAQELNEWTAETAENTIAADADIIGIDSIVADTMVADPDPEWYVAPIPYDSIMARHKAPRRAAAADCPIDSVRIFDADSNLVAVTIYEYGDTVRATTWTIKSDGSRIGESKQEYANDGWTFYGATFNWDNTTNNWKGVSRADTVYNEKHKPTSRTIYAWINNGWLPDTKYTYTYDASNRENEYTTYKRNTSTNQLMTSAKRIREWFNASKTTLDIQYSAFSNELPTAGKKTECAYDASGNTLNKTYYASYSGGWVASSGSTKEIWEYTAGKNTYYEKHTGSATGWVKNTKKVWKYNEAGKETYSEVYGVNNNEWAITNQNTSGYNEYNNLTSVEKYTFNKTTGVKTGSEKYECTLKGNTTLQTEKIQYKWVAASAVWVNNIKTVKAYNDANKVTDSYTCNWINEEWIGVYTRTKTTYSGANATEVLTMSWSSDIKDWVNSTLKETEYSGSNKTKEVTSKWQDDTWLFTGRTDYHWTNGKNDTTTTYTTDGINWTNSERTVNTFNAAGTNIMTHKATWQNDKWTLKSMSRTDIVDHVVDGRRQTLTASWTCGSDSVWIGQKKDTTLYSTTGKTLYTASYKGWKDNDWLPVSKSNFYYDELDRSIDEQNFKWDNGWKGNIRNEYGYDAKGRRNMIATYVGWDNTTNYWKGSNKTEYSFNDQGNTDFYIIYKWGGSDWVFNYRHSFKYDAKGNEIEDILEEYINNSWVNKTKYEKEYIGGNQTKDNEYTWLNNQWMYRYRNEYTYDEDAQAKLRREIEGAWDNGSLLSFSDKFYNYSCDPKACIVTFRNYDGTSLQSGEVASGTIPKYTGDTPTKPSNAQYTYSFKGWSPELVAATGEATYTAQYDSVVNTYVIAFENYDGTSLQSGEVAYGTTPKYTGDTPAKPSNAQYTYSFKGWDAELVAVTAAATYTAQFDSVVNTYVIAFENYDGTSLQSGEVAYGTQPTYTGDTPTKPSTAQYTYSFKDWDAELVEVTAAATYTAQFDSVVNTYVIAFENYDGTSLQSGEVAYGTTPKYTGDTPNKLSTPEYTYTFTGWSPEVVAVTETATYTAQYDSTKNSYLITWLYDDGSEISHATLEYGATPTPADATKPATAQYSFVFKGWNTEVVPVTGEATYTAVYDSIVNQYTVVFYFEDGVTEIERVVLAYGETPSTSYVPSIPGDKQYTYVFVGWSPEIAPVTGDASYTAVFKAVPRQYTIVFKNYNGAELLRTQVDYGTIPVYTGDTPAKKADTRYTYQFDGWTPELTEVTGDATYTAVFKSVLQQYTIVFRNYDGTELQTSLVDYGTMPVYTGETPVKEEDEQYTYSFSGWTPALKQVSGDATYTAKYTSKPKSHEGLNDVEAASQATKVMIDGRIYILRAGHLYTLSGSLVE